VSRCTKGNARQSPNFVQRIVDRFQRQSPGCSLVFCQGNRLARIGSEAIEHCPKQSAGWALAPVTKIVGQLHRYTGHHSVPEDIAA
jgi:hypothetical protein